MAKKHPLAVRHTKQITGRSIGLRRQMASRWAYSIRPGDGTDTFLGKAYRPLGSLAHIVQASEVVGPPGDKWETIHLLGYRAQQDPETGEVHFGGEAGACFAYDFSMLPFVGATKRVLDPARNPTLLQLGLFMDQARQDATERSFRLPTSPKVPQVFLGFSEDALPPPVDTPAIRQRIAAHMRGDGASTAKIDTMPPEERDMLIRAEWPSLWVQPGGENWTGLCLIASQFYPHPKRALRAYEYVGHMLGTYLPNPAVELLGGKYALSNPAYRVANRAAVELTPGCDYSAEEAEKLLQGMRKAIGPYSQLVSDDELAEALDNPKRPLSLPGLKLDGASDAALIEVMRDAMDCYDDCVYDADLLQAARNPSEPLYAAGLAGVQVLFRRGRLSSLRFGPHELGPQTHADFWSTRRHWRIHRRPARASASAR